jgi:hypothetical protein
LLQTLAAEVVADTVIVFGGIGVFALLPPLSIVVVVGAGNSLLVHFAASGFNTAAGNSTLFRLRVDGVVVKGSSFSRPTGGGPNGEATAAIVKKITGLAAGAHTVDIQANTTTGTTTINAATQPNEQGATLLVEEVSV